MGLNLSSSSSEANTLISKSKNQYGEPWLLPIPSDLQSFANPVTDDFNPSFTDIAEISQAVPMIQPTNHVKSEESNDNMEVETDPAVLSQQKGKI